jgi:hypothetical protein
MVPLVSIAIVAFVIGSFAGTGDPDRRGATVTQLVCVAVGTVAMVAGLIAWAGSGSEAPCRSYARRAVVGDC